MTRLCDSSVHRVLDIDLTDKRMMANVRPYLTLEFDQPTEQNLF